MEQTQTLALVSYARRALGEAKTLPDIRRVMEAAAVAADANRRAAKLAEASGMAAEVVKAANDAANDAAAVRIEAQAKAGEILRAMPKATGTRGQLVGRNSSGDTSVVSPENQHPTLTDAGITPNQSSRWQHVANIPEPVRKEYVEAVKEDGGEVSTAGLVRYDLQRRVEDQDRAIESVVQDDWALANARYKAALSAARHRLRSELLPLTTERVTTVYNRIELRELLDDIADLRLWCDRMESAIRDIRLEVVNGHL